MIDYLAVFELGGVFLFEKLFISQQEKQKINEILKQFINKVFIQQREELSQKILIDKKIVEFHLDKKMEIIYLIIYPEIASQTNFQNFLNSFIELFEKKYLKNLVRNNKALFEIWFYKDKVQEDLNMILQSTDFTSQNQSTVQKKWEKKEEKKDLKKIEAKIKTSWDPLITSKKRNKQKDDSLNFSTDTKTDQVDKYREQFMPTKEEEDELKDSFVFLSDSDVEEVQKGFFSKMSSLFTEGQEMGEKNLEQILESFKKQLISKNVSEEVSRLVCQNLKEKLKNQKLKLFSSQKKIVKQALEESLKKILTPNKNINLLSSALKKKDKGRPFVIIFIGVNGVGKSTTLAKVAYLFKNNGFSVLLAACDNFRSGAVEQLKTHGRCLEVPVFERGYDGNPATLARDAIIEANQKKIDVVLVDTAGRMQDNQPLMQALANMVNVNNPDIVLFIGEALTGNDGTDQLIKFNRALKELSSNLKREQGQSDEGREIDGVLLTKFDTVDDKVGATINLVYTTGKPIVYVGTGQKYHCLNELNVQKVVKQLLS